MTVVMYAPAESPLAKTFAASMEYFAETSFTIDAIPDGSRSVRAMPLVPKNAYQEKADVPLSGKMT